MQNFSVPTRGEVSENNQAIFDNLKGALGFGCRYCQSAHTALGKMNGFSDEQILEIRGGSAAFDAKLDALAKFTKSVVENRGNATLTAKDAFFAANLTGFAIDFPLAPELSEATV